MRIPDRHPRRGAFADLWNYGHAPFKTPIPILREPPNAGSAIPGAYGR